MTPLPRLLSAVTAAPPHVLRQEEVLPAAVSHFGPQNASFQRLMTVYANAAIDTRRSCMPLEWYGRDHSFAERNALFLEHAVTLLENAAVRATEAAGLTLDEIDGLVVVSSSGIATPSLDALLMERMQLRRDMMRLPIFGLGCAGGTLGLGRAAALARGTPTARYLFLVVEVCGLTFRHNDFSKSNIVATALFADGAAGAVVSCEGDGPTIRGWGEHTWPGSLDIMGWDVRDDGLAVVFSRDIPHLVRTKMRAATDHFLARQDLGLGDIGGFICHPGGIKVVEALEELYGLPAGGLTHSRGVLRRFGNMSAATVMFVLADTLADREEKLYLMQSLGPGFTAGFLLLDTRPT